MKPLQKVKLLGLVVGIAIPNIIVFSPGLLGVSLSGGAFQAAFGSAILFASALALLYGAYNVLFKRPQAAPVRVNTRPVRMLKTSEDFTEALQQHLKERVLRDDVTHALDQIERVQKKKATLLQVLGQRFEPTEISYQKFHSAILEVEKLFYANISGILIKLNVFDVSEFTAIASGAKSAAYSSKLLQERKQLYQEYINNMKGYLGANEEILLKMDKLVLEISMLESAGVQDVEEMACMKEIDTLIKQTKLYKH